jgi:hypothetical protein
MFRSYDHLQVHIIPRTYSIDNGSVVKDACGICDRILLPVGMLLPEICGLIFGRLPLWREGGSAIYSAITQWSEPRRTRNHTLLFHLRLPQPRGSDSRIYIPQERGGPVIPPGTGFALNHFLNSHKHTNGYKIQKLSNHEGPTSIRQHFRFCPLDLPSP